MISKKPNVLSRYTNYFDGVNFLNKWYIGKYFIKSNKVRLCFIKTKYNLDNL